MATLIIFLWSVFASAGTTTTVAISKASWVITLCANNGVICPENIVGENGAKNDQKIVDLRAIYAVGDDFGWEPKIPAEGGVSPISKVANLNVTPPILIGATNTINNTPASSNGVQIALVDKKGGVFWANPTKWTLKESVAGLFGVNKPKWINRKIYYGGGGKNMLTRVKTGTQYSFIMKSQSGYFPTAGKYGSILMSKVTRSCFNSLFFPTIVPTVSLQDCGKIGTSATVSADPYPYQIRFADIVPTNDEANPRIIGQGQNAAVRLDNILVGSGLKLITKTDPNGNDYKSVEIGNPNQDPEVRFDPVNKSITLAANNPALWDIWPNKGTPAKLVVASVRNTGDGREAPITKNAAGNLTATLTKKMIADSEKGAFIFLKYANGEKSFFGESWSFVNMTTNTNGSHDYGMPYTPSEVDYNKTSRVLTVTFNTNQVVGYSGKWVEVTEKICLRGNNPGWTGCAVGALPVAGTDGRLTVSIPYPADVDPMQIFTTAIERGDINNADDDLWMDFCSPGYWSEATITGDIEISNCKLRVKQ